MYNNNTIIINAHRRRCRSRWAERTLHCRHRAMPSHVKIQTSHRQTRVRHGQGRGSTARTGFRFQTQSCQSLGRSGAMLAAQSPLTTTPVNHRYQNVTIAVNITRRQHVISINKFAITTRLVRASGLSLLWHRTDEGASARNTVSQNFTSLILNNFYKI